MWYIVMFVLGFILGSLFILWLKRKKPEVIESVKEAIANA